MEDYCLFKITIEDCKKDKKAVFFVNGIEGIISSDFFNKDIVDAKTGDRVCLKQVINEQLNKA